jgi:hypothetical protein
MCPFNGDPQNLDTASDRLQFVLWGRPGFDVVGSPEELQAEVPGRPRKTTGNNVSADKNLALAA